MSELFSNGRIVDIIIVCMVLEWIAIVAYKSRTGNGITPPDLSCNLLAGVFLMLALRGALVGAAWQWIALCLAAALPAHLSDLVRRWQR